MRARWAEDEVVWGVTLCTNRRCLRPAELLVDEEPFCIACADELLERFALVSLHPELRETLPPLWE